MPAIPRSTRSARHSLRAVALGAAALAIASRPAPATEIIVQCYPPGSEQRCPLGPLASGAGVLEYEPDGGVDAFVGDTLLTTGWIEVPSAPGLVVTALSGAEIRSIELPSGVLEAPVSVSADGSPIGAFGPGASIDFENLVGAAVHSLTLSGIDLVPNAELTLRLAMRSFDVDAPGALSGNPGRVSVAAIPEPGPALLLALGFAAIAARRPA
jgi:hypothetical protein